VPKRKAGIRLDELFAAHLPTITVRLVALICVADPRGMTVRSALRDKTRKHAARLSPSDRLEAFKEQSSKMPSSWRWTKTEDFIEYVNPHALNKVDHVRNQRVLYCFAESCQTLFDHVAALRQLLARLRSLLAESKAINVESLNVAVEMCHHGESMLLLQRRLAIGSGAYAFLHGKDAVKHAAHELSKPTFRHHLVQFCKDTEELLTAFDAALHEDAAFLVVDVSALPEDLAATFRTARDLSSVGFEDVALLICGRGFEQVVRRVLKLWDVTISAKGVTTVAAEAGLNDVIETMRRLRWKDDASKVFSAPSMALMQWVRQVRNVEAHPGEDDVAADERTSAKLAAQVSARVWALLERNLNRDLESREVIKNW